MCESLNLRLSLWMAAVLLWSNISPLERRSTPISNLRPRGRTWREVLVVLDAHVQTDKPHVLSYVCLLNEGWWWRGRCILIPRLSWLIADIATYPEKPRLNIEAATETNLCDPLRFATKGFELSVWRFFTTQIIKSCSAHWWLNINLSLKSVSDFLKYYVQTRWVFFISWELKKSWSSLKSYDSSTEFKGVRLWRRARL